MKTKIKLNNRGFTIVETLIVLAIAAIIIIIVLLAVPALQRTTRNTDIKNDATSVSASVSDYESNQGGGVPLGVLKVANSNKVEICSTAGCVGGGNLVGANATVQSSDFVTPQGGGTVPLYASNAPGNTNVVGPGVIVIHLGFVCESTTGINTGSDTSSPNQVAVYYPDETGTTTGNVLCVQS